MKSYSCLICFKRGKEFSGIRRDVRKHIHEEHRIKGGQTTFKSGGTIGTIVKNMIVIEI